MNSISSTAKELEAVGIVLLDDLFRCAPNLDYLRDLDQYSRRQFVRSAFAFMEGLTYSMKQHALGFCADGLYEFSTGELSLLQEQAWELDDNGAVKGRSANLSFARNIRFSFAALGRSIGDSFSPSYGDSGWEALQKAAKVRNRLMHPKSASDLDVSNDDIEIVGRGLRWFQRNFVRLCRAVADRAEEYADRLGTDQQRSTKPDEYT